MKSQSLKPIQLRQLSNFKTCVNQNQQSQKQGHVANSESYEMCATNQITEEKNYICK